jgi:hypothetical protein
MLVDDFHQRARGWGAGFKVSEFQGFNVTGSVSFCAPSLLSDKKKSPAKAGDRNFETLKP